MKKKKVTIHQKNKDYKCFQYATTVALNHEKVGPHPESVSKIKPFLNKYNWYGIKYLSKMDDQKAFEKKNRTIVLNALYSNKEMTICSAYIQILFQIQI